MYQAKSGQKPPTDMATALAVFQNMQIELLARGVANAGHMPRNLSSKQRAAVAKLVARNVKPTI